jgi:hypothetical protein
MEIEAPAAAHLATIEWQRGAWTDRRASIRVASESGESAMIYHVQRMQFVRSFAKMNAMCTEARQALGVNCSNFCGELDMKL